MDQLQNIAHMVLEDTGLDIMEHDGEEVTISPI